LERSPSTIVASPILEALNGEQKISARRSTAASEEIKASSELLETLLGSEKENYIVALLTHDLNSAYDLKVAPTYARSYAQLEEGSIVDSGKWRRRRCSSELGSKPSRMSLGISRSRPTEPRTCAPWILRRLSPKREVQELFGHLVATMLLGSWHSAKSLPFTLNALFNVAPRKKLLIAKNHALDCPDQDSLNISERQPIERSQELVVLER
jgi:hypothetical protein